MPPRLQTLMSALTQSDHVFLGLPHTFEHGISILVTDLIQDEDRTTCPYHLRRLERRAAVTSCIPSLAHSKSMEISSWDLMPQIHLIIDLSFQQSRCESEDDSNKWSNIGFSERMTQAVLFEVHVMHPALS